MLTPGTCIAAISALSVFIECGTFLSITGPLTPRSHDRYAVESPAASQPDSSPIPMTFEPLQEQPNKPPASLETELSTSRRSSPPPNHLLHRIILRFEWRKHCSCDLASYLERERIGGRAFGDNTHNFRAALHDEEDQGRSCGQGL